MTDLTPPSQRLLNADVASTDDQSVVIGEDVELEVGAGRPAPAKGGGPIVGRSPGQLAWLRLRRDRMAMTNGVIVLGFIVVAVAAPLIELVYGLSPYAFNGKLLDQGGLPLGFFGGITFTPGPDGHIHPLGVEPRTGRDIFILLVYGARTSLIIAVGASTIAVALGIFFGVLAAYLGGWVDAVLSWFIDYMLAFPFLLFAIAVIPVVNLYLQDASGGVEPWKRVLTIIVIFSLFSWMGTARLVRGQVLSLREREYVEAARAAGAGGRHIMFRQILPNLWAPILVVYSLAVPATVTAEAALSFLGIGVVEPTPDWGRMVNSSIPWLPVDPMYTFIPGILIFVLVLSFNLFGDSLRDALDPKSVK
jgi:peptide/nickel transport system permease protein